MNRAKFFRRDGFTLIELLVAAGVSIILGVAVLGAFIQSRRSFEHSIGTVDLVRATRPAMDRIGQYLTSAVVKPGEETILFPQNRPGAALNLGTPGKTNERGQTIVADQPSTWPSYIVFRTTEDFLSPTFDPNEIMNIINGVQGLTHQQLMQTYKSDSHNVYDYILWWEDSHLDKLPNIDKALVLARIEQWDSNGDGIYEYRPDSWAAIGADPWADIEPNIAPRVIAMGGGGDNGGAGLASVNFLPLGSNGINVSILGRQRVRTHTNVEDKEFRLDSVIQLPSLTMAQ